MAKWYNYLGIFTAYDYEMFLSTYEINQLRTTKEELKELIYEMYETGKVKLMAELMIRKAIFDNKIVKKDNGYSYNGPNYACFVRME